MTLKEYIGKYTIENGLNTKMAERNITPEKIESYVIECAKKELNSKDGAIDDGTINNWIVHFIENIYKEKVEEQPKVEVKVVAPDTRDEQKGEVQLSLFDCLNQ